MYVAGAYIRLAALIMVVNFIAALTIAHVGATFQQSFDAWMMLSGSLFFLVNGTGKISVDEFHAQQK